MDFELSEEQKNILKERLGSFKKEPVAGVKDEKNQLLLMV